MSAFNKERGVKQFPSPYYDKFLPHLHRLAYWSSENECANRD